MRESGSQLVSIKKLFYSFLLFVVVLSSHAQGTIRLQQYVDSMIQQKEIKSQQLIGTIYPAFAIANTSEGGTINNQALKGKITIINFWFEACAPCIAELDALSNLYNKYKNNASFQFLSLTVDNSETAQKAVKKYNIPYAVYPITKEDAYKMNFHSGFPTSIIINRAEEILFFTTGGHTEKEMADKQVKEMEDIIAQNLTIRL